MRRNRYLQILRCLHFSNNEEIVNHPLKKLKPVIDDLREKFSNSILPGQNLYIDESLILWKGKLYFKQFLPLKRHRFGIKLFNLVDCKTGFLIDFIVYTGSDTDYEKFGLGITGDIVAHFLKNFFNKGHVIYVDNWYSSPELAKFLHHRDTGIYGTVKKNRKFMPRLENKLNKGEIQVAHNDVWLVMKWMDKREVYMITTVHEVRFSPTGKKHWRTKEDIVKPLCICEYNKNMGGIDNIDKQLSITETIRKTMKWYQKLFFHFVDLALANAHVLYNQKVEKKLSFPEFRIEVVRRLFNLEVHKHSYLAPTHSRLTGRHFPVEISNKGSSAILQRKCKLCVMKKIKRRSKYECNICHETLCIIPCFKTYHTKSELP
ncbi:piggyBac transposable element-derived protein 4-like [Pseudomyrmex gracilis]|uniref:piggyBac transposable element-derived protein 4-like n=1 Tax=Pseudomyrmex gracilis TaxID=219809 RepID=UPI00099541F8|nr:piggyBac transposable element-derived protein 4-like [Pseudomyrmex gracilis]